MPVSLLQNERTSTKSENGWTRICREADFEDQIRKGPLSFGFRFRLTSGCGRGNLVRPMAALIVRHPTFARYIIAAPGGLRSAAHGKDQRRQQEKQTKF